MMIWETSMGSVLEGQNMRVITAINGKDALLKLQQHHEIEIVLMDIMMPEMVGYQAMQEFMRQNQFKIYPLSRSPQKQW